MGDRRKIRPADFVDDLVNLHGHFVNALDKVENTRPFIFCQPTFLLGSATIYRDTLKNTNWEDLIRVAPVFLDRFFVRDETPVRR